MAAAFDVATFKEHSMLRVGVVGFGMASRVFHAPLISSVEGLELAAVVERRSDQAAQRYPGLTTYRALDDLLADRSIDLVVVATPSGTHFDVARLVLEAGKHVVVDKPASVTSGEIAHLIALAKAKQVLLIPFHNRRWDGDFLTVQRLVHENQLGRMVYFESRFDRWNPGATRRPWKDDTSQGGGVLLDLGTHLVDQALALFGKPLAVSADVVRERDGQGSDDAFTVRLRYAGYLVTLGANALSAITGPRFLLRGTRGSYRKKGVDPQEAALNKITRITAPTWGQEPAADWGLLYTDIEGGMVSRPVATVAGDYRRFYEGVRDALLGKAPAPVSAVEAWRVARVLEWARASSEQRCETECDWSGEPVDA
jgi:predicted dehydrogenase